MSPQGTVWGRGHIIFNPQGTVCGDAEIVFIARGRDWGDVKLFSEYSGLFGHAKIMLLAHGMFGVM